MQVSLVPRSLQGLQSPTQQPWVNPLGHPYSTFPDQWHNIDCDHLFLPSTRLNTYLDISWASTFALSRPFSPLSCFKPSYQFQIIKPPTTITCFVFSWKIPSAPGGSSCLEVRVYQRYDPPFQADYPPSFRLTSSVYMFSQHQGVFLMVAMWERPQQRWDCSTTSWQALPVYPFLSSSATLASRKQIQDFC